MTSLKIQHANEIIEGMMKTLGDEEFMGVFRKEASVKEAAGEVLETFVNAVETVKGDAAKIDDLWNKYLPALQAEENQKPGTIDMAMRVRESAKGGPGTTVPADDEACDYMADDCEPCVRAARFAITHMVKVADALDRQGFDDVASDLDKAMVELAKKYKVAGEKPPKGAETRPPKKWFDHWEKKLKDEEGIKTPAKLIGHIWDNVLSDKERQKIKDGKVDVWVSPQEFAKAKK